MASKLNPKNTAPKTVQAAAAKYDLVLETSANGNLQFKKEPLQHLYELTVSTLFGKNSYYKTSDQFVVSLRKEVKEAVSNDSLDFIANLAVHARGEMNIRTMPIVLVVEFAKELREQNKTYPQLRKLVTDVIQRADQITDLYAYALDVFGDKKAVPVAIKRGVADAFNKFGEYNFAKYSSGGAVKFRDMLRIVHPVAKDVKHGEIFKKIMEDSLEVPYTWETQLSKNGQLPVQEQKTKKELWTELFTSGKMGYMAQLRNLRNLLQAGVTPETKRQVADFISKKENVLQSKQLTFDFVEAYNIVKPLDSALSTAISKAIDASVANLPEIGKKIWVIIDFSGSMGSDSHPAITNATILAAALLKANETADNLAVTLFGSGALTLHGVDTNNSVLAIQKELLSHRKGSIAGSTEFGVALREHTKLGFTPDTIIVLTDGEVNRFPYSDLRQATGQHNVVKITVNLHAAPTTPLVKQDGWQALAGWSPSMFKWIKASRDKETVVDQLSVPYVTKG